MPHAAIAALDNALAQPGRSESVTLRRPVGAGPSQTFKTVTLNAAISALSDQQIAAGITQTELNFILSPTEITNSGWPNSTAAVQAPPFNPDTRIPIAQRDQIIARGKVRTITAVQPLYAGNELVRIEGRMEG